MNPKLPLTHANGTGPPGSRPENLPPALSITLEDREILAYHLDTDRLDEALKALEPDPLRGLPHQDPYYLEQILYELTEEATHVGDDARRARDAIAIFARHYKLAARILAEIDRIRPPA